jgi:hypothetical protein
MEKMKKSINFPIFGLYSEEVHTELRVDGCLQVNHTPAFECSQMGTGFQRRFCVGYFGI